MVENTTDKTNEIIKEIAKEFNLKTDFKPSFNKNLSIILNNKGYINISQIQKTVNKGLGVLGGATYELTNKYRICHNNSVIITLKLKEIKDYLQYYIKEFMRIEEIKRGEY